MPSRSYFFITSHGFCATKWLSSVLSKHPDVFCTHSLGPHNKHGEPYSDREILENTVATIRNFDRPGIEIVNEQAPPALEKTVLGNVHGFTLQMLLRNVRLHPKIMAANPVRIANLVRHPVDWVHSATANWLAQSRFSAFARKGMIGALNRSGRLNPKTDLYATVWRLSEQYGFDPLSWETLAFVYGCDTLQDIAQDLRRCNALKIPVIEMEQCTQNREYLKSTMMDSLGIPKVDDDYLSSVFATKPQNAHARSKHGTAHKFSNWLPWQRSLFRQTFETSGSRPLHEAIGYEFSCIDR
jgi:hypothetical protein